METQLKKEMEEQTRIMNNLDVDCQRWPKRREVLAPNQESVTRW